MLKKSVTYLDFNDKEVTEDFYFHLSKAELVELEVNTEGGLQETLQKIIDTEDNREIWNYFKKFVLLSYGQKSEDGKHFLKSDSLRLQFESTNAFDTLLMTLLEDGDEGASFFNGIMPKDLVDDAVKIAEAQAKTPPTAENPRVLTQEEIISMPDEELRSGLAEGRFKLAE